MTMALQRPMLPLPTAEALSIPGETGGRETVEIRWVSSPLGRIRTQKRQMFRVAN